MDDNTTRADLAVYSITALITGAVWAVAAFFIALGISYAYPGVTPWIPAVTIGSAALLVTWSYFLSVHIIPNLKQPERKPAQPAVTRIEHVSADKKQLKYEDCPATMEQLEAVAVKVFDYGGITSAAGEQIFGGRIPYENFRDWMMTPIRREYFQWVNTFNHKQGVEVTKAGYEWLADYYPPPPEAVAYRIEDDLGVTHTRIEES